MIIIIVIFLGCRRELTLSVTNNNSLLETNEVLVSLCIPYSQEVHIHCINGIVNKKIIYFLYT